MTSRSDSNDQVAEIVNAMAMLGCPVDDVTARAIDALVAQALDVVEHLAATYVRAERNYQSVCHDEDESLAAGAMSDRAFNAGRDKDLAFLALEAHVTKLTPMVTKTGRLLTDEEINALADEAERGYDVTELIKARWE